MIYALDNVGQEWAALEAEKKKLYVGLKQIRENIVVFVGKHLTLPTYCGNIGYMLESCGFSIFLHLY